MHSRVTRLYWRVAREDVLNTLHNYVDVPSTFDVRNVQNDFRFVFIFQLTSPNYVCIGFIFNTPQYTVSRRNIIKITFPCNSNIEIK